MLNRSRTAMALLVATSVFALPTSVLAAQDSGEAKETRTKTRNSFQRDAQASPKFHIAGPSRYAVRSGQPIAGQRASSSSIRSPYTAEELAEIRAAQIRLVRSMTSGPGGLPGGGAGGGSGGGSVLSHPTLGRIIVKSPTGALVPAPGGSGGLVRGPIPGLISGPNPMGGPGGGLFGGDPETGSREPADPGAGSGSGGGSSGGSSGGSGDFPVLVPGGGFAGPTSQPPAVGNPHLRGYDAQAIARWDVVPYQDFDGLFHIGVVAFHMNGIDRVEFSVNGGPWAAVREMQLNPRTNVWEYTATLDASQFDDGLVEVRAKVFPRNAGEVRVLAGEIDGYNGGSPHFRNGIHSMFLNANAGGTLPRHEVYADAVNGSDTEGDGTRDNPFKTATHALAFVTERHGNSDGAICYLLPGEYVWSAPTFPDVIRTEYRWASVAAAPGVDREDVIFVNNEASGLRTRLLRAENVTMTGEGTPRTLRSMDTYFWADDVTLAGSSRFSGGGLASGSSDWAGIYGTDVVSMEIRAPFRSATFVRNVSATGFSDVPFGADTMVLNGDLRDFSRNPDGDHADVFHWFWRDDQDRENRIIYGLRVYEFPLLGFLMNPIRGGEQEVKDVAIVNVHISQDEPSVASSMWGLDTDHLVISGLQLPDQTFRFDVHRQDADGQLSLRNVSVTNSIFAKITGDAMPEDATFRNIHIIDGTSHKAEVPVGVNITVGNVHGGDTREQVFVSPRSKNWSPRPSSIVWGRFPASDLMAPADVMGRPATGDMVPLGAYFGDGAAGG